MPTKLIVIRGNSGSGKSTVARRLRRGYGRGCALIEQDYLRRIVLRERDLPGGLAPALIDQTVRFALDHDYHAVLEGILLRDRYGPMLAALLRAYPGRTSVFYLDVSLAETLRRHTTRPQAAEFGPADMRGWYVPRGVLGCAGEHVVPESSTLDQTVDLIARTAGLPQTGAGSAKAARPTGR
jgi:predicted kinase